MRGGGEGGGGGGGGGGASKYKKTIRARETNHTPINPKKYSHKEFDYRKKFQRLEI